MKRFLDVVSITYISLGVALLALCSQMTLSLGSLVPFTLQTLAVGLITTLYKPKEAILSVACFLIFGALGVPVFSGFQGGIAIFGTPKSGFLIGFLVYTLAISWMVHPFSKNWQLLLANLIGIGLLLGCGVSFMIYTLHYTPEAAITSGLTPFILTSALQLTGIVAITKGLAPSLKKVDYFK